MPYAPYPVDGTVVDINGSTAVKAVVVAYNCTTHEKQSTTCNSSGQFIIDCANFTSGYTDGDHIQITAFYGSDSGKRSLSKRHTIAVATGQYEAGTMILHEGDEPILDTNITFAGGANTTAGGLYIDFYDRYNDQKVFRLEIAAGSVSSFPFGYLGKFMKDGFIRVFESETAGSLVATTVEK